MFAQLPKPRKLLPVEAVSIALLKPWLRYLAIGIMVIAVGGIGIAFKSSYAIIPQMDQDPNHLVWSAFEAQREFNEFKRHIEVYSATGDQRRRSDAMLWLDAMYGRLQSFEGGRWAEAAESSVNPKAFASLTRDYLDRLDALLIEREAQGHNVHRYAKPIIDQIDRSLSTFLSSQQKSRLASADNRSRKAQELLSYQQYLLAGILGSLGVLFLLVWLRSQQAVWVSTHDTLTGLGNRAATIARLQRDPAQAQGRGQLAVHCLDLDRFKMVNDTLGHKVGDELLIRFARRLEAMVGDTGFLARTGSNQFVILQNAIENDECATRLAQKIVFSATNEFKVGDHQLRVGISMGIAISSASMKIDTTLLERADLALYEAKRRGGNTAVVFDPQLEERAKRHRRIDSDLRKALEYNELVNYYQPKIDLKTRRVCGAEALLRWVHPEHGMIRPDHFIPIAEDTRLIIPIGAWATDRACADAKLWSEMLDGNFHIAVNLSPVQFESDMLVGEVRAALKRHGLPAHLLELEITESTLMVHNNQVETAMKRLRDLGIHFALDDFGTGYSSLSYLDHFRFDKVKIDRSFVMGLDPETRQSPIIEAVVHMGRGYNFSVCAEGIESAELAELLEELGCHEAQGYYFGKPMPADEFTAFLASQNECEGGEAMAKSKPIREAVDPQNLVPL